MPKEILLPEGSNLFRLTFRKANWVKKRKEILHFSGKIRNRKFFKNKTFKTKQHKMTCTKQMERKKERYIKKLK